MRSLVAFVTVFLLVCGGAALALAQEADPGVAEGVTVAVLARGVVDRLAPGRPDVGLLRLTIPPATRVPVFPSRDAALLLVESGTVAFEIAPASAEERPTGAATPLAADGSAARVEFSLGPGESAILPALAEGEARNDGAGPAVVLALVAGPPTSGVPAPPSDNAAGVSAAGVRFEALSIGTDEELPPGRVEMAIARTTIAPGVTAPPQSRAGPEVGIVESGSVTFHTTEGPGVVVLRGIADVGTPWSAPTVEMTGPDLDVTANAGDGYFIPAGSLSGSTAGGDAEAVALFGVLTPRGVASATPEP